MFAATTSPSYSPTWVSGQMPVTSPIAQRRSPARRCSSTGMPRGSASTPTVSRPMPSTRGRRPVATSSRSPRSSVPPSNSQDELVAVPPRGGGVHPQHQLDPVPAQRLAERLAQRRGLAGQHAVGALDEHRLAAETAHDLRHLDARRAAAQHEQAARDGLHARRLAGAPHALELTQSRDRGHDRIRAGRHDDVLRGVPDAVDLDHAGAGQPARAAQQVDAPLRQPALLAGVGVVRDHEVPPGQRGLDVDLGARPGVARALHRLARAQQGLGRDARPVGALAADQLSLDDGDAQSARRQRRGAVLAGGAAAEDDHVVVIARAHRYLRRLRRSASVLGWILSLAEFRYRRAVAPVEDWSMPWSRVPTRESTGASASRTGDTAADSNQRRSTWPAPK